MFKRAWTMALIAGTAALGFLSACKSSQKSGSTALAPELKLERVHFRVWRGDALRVSGDAAQVVIRRDTSHAAASEVRAELTAEGTPVVVTAPSVEGDLSTQEFTGTGGVVVTHAGERATTDRARYVPGPSGHGLVTGRDAVTVERGDLRLEGVGFTFDPLAGDLQLGGPVRTRSAGAPR